MTNRNHDQQDTVEAHLGLFRSPPEEEMSQAEERALHRLRTESRHAGRARHGLNVLVAGNVQDTARKPDGRERDQPDANGPAVAHDAQPGADLVDVQLWVEDTRLLKQVDQASCPRKDQWAKEVRRQRPYADNDVFSGLFGN